MFKRLRIVLVNTSHPGNIGAVARAIKNMGFSELYLVSPVSFPSEEATARASGAEDILSKAVVTYTLEEALVDCDWVLGLSARIRKIPWPILEARAAAKQMVIEWEKHPTTQIALVFGSEQSGLLNEELAKCHYQVNISADLEYSSLNLAQAVQILTYECRQAILDVLNSVREISETSETSARSETPETPETHETAEISEDLATTQEMEHYYKRLEQNLILLKFLDVKATGHLMRRLRRLYGKTRVDKTELKILQGILTATEKMEKDIKKHLNHETTSKQYG